MCVIDPNSPFDLWATELVMSVSHGVIVVFPVAWINTSVRGIVM